MQHKLMNIHALLVRTIGCLTCLLQTQSIPQATLTSDLEGTLCQSVEIVCAVHEITSLNWYYDGVVINTYTYTSGDSYPRTTYNTSGVVIEMTFAMPMSILSDSFNGTSTLRTTILTLTQLNVDSIRCGTNAVRSQEINITMLTVLANSVSVFAPITRSPIASSNNYYSGIPSPLIECYLLPFGNREYEVSLVWPPLFTSTHGVGRYRVAATPDPSSCFTEQASPSMNYRCPGLEPNSVYTFTVSAIADCVSQEGRRSSFSIQPQAPQMITNISVHPVYDDDASLIEVHVEWRRATESHISPNCTFNQLDYIVGLVDSMGATVAEQVVSSDNCSGSVCSTTFTSFPSERNYYRVRITSTNGIGESSEIATSSSIDGSNSLSILFSSSNCTVTFMCNSTATNGTCTLRYSMSASYYNLSDPIQSPLNTPVALPTLKPATTGYYVVSSTLLSIEIRGNFYTTSTAPKLSSANQALIGVGTILSAVAIGVGTILTIAKVKSIFEINNGIFSVVVLGTIVAGISITLWIAVVFQVLLQNNTCDPDWQSTRNSLVIAAHISSDFSLVIMIATIIATVISNQDKISYHDCCNRKVRHQKVQFPEPGLLLRS